MTKIVHPPRLRLARLGPNEVDAAVELLHGLWHATYSGRLPAHLVRQRSIERSQQHLELRAGKSWLAWLDRKLAGISATTANCVEDVWVKLRYRRRGIATRLIDAACTDLAQRGFRAAQTRCEDFNHAASALFENLGWRQIGAELVQIAPGIRHEALVYARPLPLQEAS